MGTTGRIARWFRRRVDALEAWEAAKPKRAGRACYRAYTQLFVPFAIVVLIALPLGGRELMWSVDGLNQYYPFFVYEGEWIRGIVGGLFSGQGLNVPLWAWNSGYGADVLTTFDVFLDPLNLVSAIVPAKLSEWVFQLLVVVRMYLAGLAFVFYCRTRGENRTGTVLGALMYALGGSGLTGVIWASGLHALILFPVVLAGAERILAGGRPWVFIASLACLAVVSYYFTYMSCILLVGYLAVRVVMVERPNLTPARFLRWVAIFAGLVLACLAIAGFAIVPAVSAMLGMDRVTASSTAVPLVYSFNYYVQTATSFLSTYQVGSDTYQGFGGLAFLACLVLFARKGANRELKIVFVALTALLLLPVFGSFFNGLNYATNRWTWAYALCMALVFVRMTPHLLSLDVRVKRVLIVGVAVYAVLLIVPAARTEANVAGYAALLAALALLLVSRGGDARRGMLVCAMALALSVNGFYFLSSDEGGKGEHQVPLGMAYAKLTSASVDDLALEGQRGEWWRYDAGQVAHAASTPMNRIRNNSLVLGLNGIDFYNSIYDNGVDAFHTELGIAGDDVNFSYTSLQGRADLAALLGVRYYAFRNDGSDAAPAQFAQGAEVAQRVIAGVDYRLLETPIYLPVGSTFSRAITRDDYLSLSLAQRQQALLQAVVLDDRGSGAGARTVSAQDLAYEDASAPYKVAAADGVIAEEGRFVVSRPGASVTLSIHGRGGTDTYLFVKGLKYRGLKPSDFVPESDKENMLWYRRADLFARDLAYMSPTFYEIAVKSDASPLTGFITNYTPESHMFGGKDTWLVNLGSGYAPANSVTITFSESGEYSFDELQVVEQTHERLGNWVGEARAESLENVELGCNSLKGSLDLSEPKTLLLTVAKGAGWSALVDGQPAELLRADTAFMALDLPEGHHDIELRYFTPGLKEGAAITGAGIVALVVLAFVLRRMEGHSEIMDASKQHADEGDVEP